MNRRVFLGGIGKVGAAAGLGLAAVSLREMADPGSVLAARRGYPGPTPTCAPGQTKDCSFGCQCYCIAANVCGTDCCNPATETCVVVGVDPETGDPILGCVLV